MTKRRSQTYEDMTPTWKEILPAMIGVMARQFEDDMSEKETDELIKAQQNIMEEFRRMARAADNWNTILKAKEIKEFIESSDLFKETGGRAGRLK